MSYVILMRNPASGKVYTITGSPEDGSGEPTDIATLYETADHAEFAAANQILPIMAGWPFVVVEAP